MSKPNRRNRPKNKKRYSAKNNGKHRTKRSPRKQAAFPKRVSDEELAKKLGGYLGDEYRLKYLKKVPFPYYKVKLKLLASLKPDKDVQMIHRILLTLIKQGISTQKEIKSFLGLQPPDFILQELFVLTRRDIILPDKTNGYSLTEKGSEYLEGKFAWTQTEEIEYEFLIDGLSGELKRSRHIRKSLAVEELKPIFPGQPPLDWLQERWESLCKVFNEEYPEHQLVDFVNSKKDRIVSSKLFHEDHYVVGYMEKQSPSQNMVWNIRDLSLKEVPTNEKHLSQILEKQIEFFYEKEIVEDLFRNKKEFQTAHKKVLSEKMDFPEKGYRELKNYEIRKEMLKAVKNAKKAILIESPWVREISPSLLGEIRRFLNNQDGKICILYGIGDKTKHHQPTLEKLMKLRDNFGKRKVYLVELPSHFDNRQIEMSGTHRKVLLVDNSLTIKGSFNFLKSGEEEEERFPAEEATVFYENTPARWREIFRDYQLPKQWLDFL